MDLKKITPSFITPGKGTLLISEPFLMDMHFRRSVVLLGEHNEDGSVGFVLNRLLNITTQTIVPDLLDFEFPLFYGGPVEPNTLHFIHKAGELIPGSQLIGNGIYWGGDIEVINDLMHHKVVDPLEFRFFVGYSGWEYGQLEEEIEQKAWWLTEAASDIVFDNDLENMWKNIVRTMGEDFAYMADSPENPQWN